MKTINFPYSVTIRLNEEQLSKLKMVSNIAGQSESEYLRTLIDNGETPTHRFDKEAVAQINRLGNLLNQIAAKLNSGDGLDIKTLAKIDKIKDSIDILTNLALNKRRDVDRPVSETCDFDVNDMDITQSSLNLIQAAGQNTEAASKDTQE